ncbi:MAG: arginase family protein [Nitrososphaeraceae archaeon]
MISFYDKNDSRALSLGDISANFYSKTDVRKDWKTDVLDPAYAPAVADPETDGISINEAIKLIRGFRGINIIGADIVCFTPHLDTTRITALNASSILHELVTIIADRISKNNPKK